VALAAAVTTLLMTKIGMPISTSQAVVGAIVGWNFYASVATDTASLGKIVTTWVFCPVLSAAVAVLLFVVVRWLLGTVKIHLLRLDAYTRVGLVLVGAFGSYSLGANNIANVMGVFVPDNPFSDIEVLGVWTFTATQQLFFLGAAAIGAGVLAYSQRVMSTVGRGLLRLSPMAALVVVLAQAIVLFVFASEGLERLLTGLGLPTFPLVPVSSSQAIIGAIIGVGLVKGRRNIRFSVLRGVVGGWIATPVIACVLTFVALFFVDNVFDQQVVRETEVRNGAYIEHAPHNRR
jgi:PiT family inorganic phosphate transporter